MIAATQWLRQLTDFINLFIKETMNGTFIIAIDIHPFRRIIKPIFEHISIKPTLIHPFRRIMYIFYTEQYTLFSAIMYLYTLLGAIMVDNKIKMCIITTNKHDYHNFEELKWRK